MIDQSQENAVVENENNLGLYIIESSQNLFH